MNIVLLLAHSVEEYDQIRLLSEIGHNVFSIGGYINPAHPHDPKRPALPNVKHLPELQAVVDQLGTSDNLTAAKCHIPDEILDWADVVICHHLEHIWLVPDWSRLKASGKRIVWRTVGQSVEGNERTMAPLHREGLEIVRYSPKEENIPGYCGSDAIIRFYKDPDEWNGWIGDYPEVINFSQHLRQRDPYTNWGFWSEATQGLPATTYGPGSDLGELSLVQMKGRLRSNRAYLYTGTQPASYTLGLIEAMMVGIPVVSIGPSYMNVFPYGPSLFEGHEIVGRWTNSAKVARQMLEALLADPEYAAQCSVNTRMRAIELFGKDKIAAEWKAFLGH